MNGAFSRSCALLGGEAMARLAGARVLVVGVGGVGSWAAEALVRTGVGAVTLMDDDIVAESNINRQCPATSGTVGADKVAAMASRLGEICPGCDIEAMKSRYPESGGAVDLARFDAVIDAIDSPGCKARLILDAQAAEVPVFSSMGAARRTDPGKVMVGRFEKVEGDGLAKALRARFKKLGVRPKRFTAVWSSEPPAKASAREAMGSIMPVTATFGMCLAAEAIRRLSGQS
jgi:tRNA A37 threonylcarbamoyladenosine dehydratase